jgi:hypothetical protein
MALTKMPLKIGGVDFSADTERLGYSIVYEDRKGGNSVTMMNGDEYQDIIVQKPVLTWRLDSLTMTRLAALHAAISAATYVQVQYYDTATAATKTAYFHGTISVQEVGVIRAGGYYRFKAPTLTMRAR